MNSVPRQLWELVGSLRGRRSVVVGNGESRLGLQLEDIAPDLVVLGCNALHREFVPHYLGSVDKGMTSEIVGARPVPGLTFIGPEERIQQWVQAGRDVSQAIQAETEPRGTTGPMMVRAAAVFGCDPIYLLGFDLAWAPRENRINNVYRDTPHYGSSESHLNPVHVERWVTEWERSFRNVFGDFPDRCFLQIGPNTLPVPACRKDELL